MIATKSCNGCGKTHEIGNFQVRKGKPGNFCRPCCREYARGWRDANRDKIKPSKPGSMSELDMNNYAPIPEAGCWLWLGGVDSKGYGKAPRHTNQGLHRVFYAYHVGEIPPGLCVCHKCDTPRCVNPDHLFLGTQLENAIDKERKGRGRWGKSIPRQARRGKYKTYDESARHAG